MLTSNQFAFFMREGIAPYKVGFRSYSAKYYTNCLTLTSKFQRKAAQW